MGGTTNWWKKVPFGAAACSLARSAVPTTQVLHPEPWAREVACTRNFWAAGVASSRTAAKRSADLVYIITRVPRALRYSAMARPSLLVEPVRKISSTLPGSSLRTAPAVRVLPCTTRTFSSRSARISSSSCLPPPLRGSALFSAPRPITCSPLSSALTMADLMSLLMRAFSNLNMGLVRLRKYWKPNLGMLHVCICSLPSWFRSVQNTPPIAQTTSIAGSVSGQRRYMAQLARKGLDANARVMKGRWKKDSSSVPCARNTTPSSCLRP
mmetsp:Transcript_28905/g.74183  ORF Transcript_28905/g.74183 Transcript_28905/m.74183 type:complete len:268 (+) Transcript_28905:339-1142(+)